MYGHSSKWCFVPDCFNTSVNSPNKKFVTVPDDHSRKQRWFKAARRDLPKSKSKFFCCEDHFNFEEDVENYVRFKLMGGSIKMKPHVVPHIFDKKKGAASLKRKRKCLAEEAAAESTPPSLDQSSSNFIKEEPADPSIEIEETPVSLCIKEEASTLHRPIEVAYVFDGQESRIGIETVPERLISVKEEINCTVEVAENITLSQCDQPSSTFIKVEPADLSLETEETPVTVCIKTEASSLYRSIGVQATPCVRSVYVTCDIKSEM